jgi:hypothetical protein
MNPPAQKIIPGPRRRRYLIHLCCTYDEGSHARRYAARTQLWTTRGSVMAKIGERVFTDEYELIETINPLLPQGSDVRNVISHIENPDGFLYLLYLSSEEANSLGWRE